MEDTPLLRTLTNCNHRLIMILAMIMSHHPWILTGFVPTLEVILMLLGFLDMAEFVWVLGTPKFTTRTLTQRLVNVTRSS